MRGKRSGFLSLTPNVLSGVNILIRFVLPH